MSISVHKFLMAGRSAFFDVLFSADKEEEKEKEAKVGKESTFVFEEEEDDLAHKEIDKEELRR